MVHKHSNTAGSVLLEKLIVYLPILLLFFASFQLAEVGAGLLVLRRAATAAARAAAVVIPDDPAFYNGEEAHVFDGARRDDVFLAAAMVLSASPQMDRAFDVEISPLPTDDFGPFDVTVSATFHCRLALLCGLDGVIDLTATAGQAYHRAAYEYEPLAGAFVQGGRALLNQGTNVGQNVQSLSSGTPPTSIGRTTQAVKKKKNCCRNDAPQQLQEKKSCAPEIKGDLQAQYGRAKSQRLSTSWIDLDRTYDIDRPYSQTRNRPDNGRRGNIKKNLISFYDNRGRKWACFVRQSLSFTDQENAKREVVLISYNPPPPYVSNDDPLVDLDKEKYSSDSSLTLGHIEPWSLGGPYSNENLFLERDTLCTVQWGSYKGTSDHSPEPLYHKKGRASHGGIELLLQELLEDCPKSNIKYTVEFFPCPPAPAPDGDASTPT